MCELNKSPMTEEELTREGWSQASLTSGRHLERTVEMYRELGFEVRLEEVDLRKCGQCTACFGEGGDKAYRIYTRPCAGNEPRK